MRTLNLNKNKQKGIGLLELMIAIGVSILIAIVVFATYNALDNNNKNKDEISNLSNLTTTIRNVFNTQSVYTGLANPVILKSATFPDRMRIPGNSSLIKHSWESDGVTVASHTENYTDDSFRITYKDVPEGNCYDIISATYRHYVRVIVGSVTVNGVADASRACSGATNDIIFQAR
ncbi:type 4 pilus major pilin [Vibrio splendidus]